MLRAMDHKLAMHPKDGRGVYIFCMRPGGRVVAATSGPGWLVTNGTSRWARDGRNVNPALPAGVSSSDSESAHSLVGIWSQRRWEEAAFHSGGGDHRVLAQRVGDFPKGKAPDSFGMAPNYQLGVVSADPSGCLSSYAVESMRQEILLMDCRLYGSARPGTVLTGVEIHSPSLVRLTCRADD